jgi:hypothetical protein
MSPRSEQPTLTVISWRDIPAQVVAKRGRETAKRELSARFQVAIDRAAMYAGLFDSDEYLAEWRREPRPCGDDLEAAVTEEATRIEARFTSDLLNDLAANGGRRAP